LSKNFHGDIGKDIILLSYKTENIFFFDLLKSKDSLNEFQIIKIVDCYNQPVRFESIYYDTTRKNLYNPAILKIKKGSLIYYPTPIFSTENTDIDLVKSNADTLTYKWHCNRECLESINGGQLFLNQNERTEKIILSNKRIKRVN
jgi:hypothetical protein